MEIRRKILFLITSLEDRGAENAALRLAVGLERTGEYLPEVLALKEGSGRLRIRAESEGFERLSSLGLASARSLCSAVLALRAKVLEEKIDVLYSFLFHPNVVARLAGRLAGLCLVINGERSVPGGRMAFRSLVRRWSAFLPHGYTAVSDAVRADMIDVLGTPIDRVRTIRNGVDATRFPERTDVLASRDRIRLLAMGSLSPEKSFGTLVEALKLVGDGSVELTILGEGPSRGVLEQQIRAAGLSGRIVLPGHAADVLPYLAGGGHLCPVLRPGGAVQCPSRRHGIGASRVWPPMWGEPARPSGRGDRDPRSSCGPPPPLQEGYGRSSTGRRREGAWGEMPG